MVINTRSLQIKAGKGEEVLEWSKEIAQYIEHNLNIPVEIVQLLFGSDMDRIAWVSRYDNLGQLEERLKAVDEDEGVKERLKKVEDLFEPHSFQNLVYQVVE